ncbi:hypothetical protein [Methanohalobium sp.]|uniref:hypothetical protein n=1 Tax=Methanohalobium sp. TaxID=2837493 RepID=UPI0025E5D4FE|nr:hypothetical protein [Methanohalobium sp.]
MSDNTDSKTNKEKIAEGLDGVEVSDIKIVEYMNGDKAWCFNGNCRKYVDGESPQGATEVYLDY